MNKKDPELKVKSPLRPKKDSVPSPFSRITTGVAGLDTVTQGGFLKGGVYLVLGPPGSGKTILANQLCFHQVRKNAATVVYLTLLAESHSRMMGNLRTLKFFNDEAIAKSVHYVSGYRALEKDGLKGLLLMIGQLIREKGASILLIDGVSTIGELDQSPLAFRKFVHELNTYVAASNCTAFLLSSEDGGDSNPEHTMVDGILSLYLRDVGQRTVRLIEVRKFRGSGHLYGKHSFAIGERGIEVFPRMEAVAQKIGSTPVAGHRLAFGIEGLDQMIQGGLMAQSATALVGASGTGKSILGMQFLSAGAERDEAGILFGFYESPAEIFEKSDQLGMKFRHWVEEGKIKLIWHPGLEQDLDQLGKTLLLTVKRTNAKRVFIDGVDGLEHASAFPERILQFLTGLYRQLKARGVTILFTEETSLFAADTRRQLAEFSAMNDNLIYIQHTNLYSHLKRILTVVKMRSSQFDHTSREFVIERGGAQILGPIESSESLLTGVSRKRSQRPGNRV